MSVFEFLFGLAVVAWLVQQINDVTNAFINRKLVPKLFFVSAAASFISGAAVFTFLWLFFTTTVSVVNQIISMIS